MTSFVTENERESVYNDEDDVTFNVSVMPNDDNGGRYRPVELSGMRSVMVAADDGNKMLLSFKGGCVPTGYDSPAGWLWATAVVLARIRITYMSETPRQPTDEEVVALLYQAIEEYSPYRATGFREVSYGE